MFHFDIDSFSEKKRIHLQNKISKYLHLFQHHLLISTLSGHALNPVGCSCVATGNQLSLETPSNRNTSVLASHNHVPSGYQGAWMLLTTHVSYLRRYRRPC